MRVQLTLEYDIAPPLKTLAVNTLRSRSPLPIRTDADAILSRAVDEFFETRFTEQAAAYCERLRDAAPGGAPARAPSRMTVYALQRLLGLVPVLFGISVVIFLTMKLIPGDVARALLGPMATDQSLAQLRHALGLDEAIHIQYGKWLWRALQGDLGLSPIVHKPVMDLLIPKFGNTLILAGASFVLAVVGGVTVGLLAGGAPADRGGPDRHGRLARGGQHAALLAGARADRLLRDQPAVAAEPRHVLLARPGRARATCSCT